MTKSLVSIVIPTHNRKHKLVRLVKGLLHNDYKNVEIIIIDDVSTDGTRDLLQKEFADNKTIKMYRNRSHLYTAASRDYGASLAKGEYIFFIDDDNVVTERLISVLVEALEKDSSVGEAGPVMYYFQNKKKLFWAGTKRNMTTTKTNFFINYSQLPNTSQWQTDDVPNAFMVRSSVIKKHHITFFKNLFMHYEESDYAYQIKKAGYKIIVARDAIIYHDTPEGDKGAAGFLQHTLQDEHRIYFTARNRLLFHARYSSPVQMAGIVLFWNWLFAAYYSLSIFAYQGEGHYSWRQKLKFILTYYHGIYDGFCFVLGKKL